jgi:uncharacterized protein involved in oxidation of intracellular sulfur
VKVLFVINDAPYGTEKAYNALRLAMALQKEQQDVGVRVFLMADAVGCALPGQSTPQGYYNVERMLRSVVARGGEVKLCGSCMDARGLGDLDLVKGTGRGSMAELARWSIDSDKIFTF